MYQELLKQKVDLGLRKPYKGKTAAKIKRLNELDYIYGAMSLDGSEFSRRDIEGMMEGEMPGTAALKDCVFVKNYLNTLEMMRDCLELKCSLDKRLLLKFYECLTGEASEFRKNTLTMVDFKHVPPHHADVEQLLSQLLQNAYKDCKNEIRSASRIHCGIVSLHPFSEYSEVMARLAMNYFLEEKGFLPVALGYNRKEYVMTMIECLKNKDDALFFWGLERAEYNKQVQVLQIVQMDEDED